MAAYVTAKTTTGTRSQMTDYLAVAVAVTPRARMMGGQPCPGRGYCEGWERKRGATRTGMQRKN